MAHGMDPWVFFRGFQMGVSNEASMVQVLRFFWDQNSFHFFPFASLILFKQNP